jgi:hypothetical protein
METILVLAATLSVGVILFWLGAKFGERLAKAELREERKHSTLLLRQRNEAKISMDLARKNVAKMGLDPKKVFPWLMLLVSLCLWSCGGGGTPAYAQPPGGTSYSPDSNLEVLDVTTIQMAASTVDLAAFSLTDPAIVDALLTRSKAGIKVRIYLDRGELEAECRGDSACARSPLKELIGIPNVDIRVKFSKVLMHLKSYAVDKSLVRDGSANFSPQGERSQDNSATFSTDAGAAARFETKFEAMWNRPGNLTVAQAVAGTGK